MGYLHVAPSRDLIPGPSPGAAGSMPQVSCLGPEWGLNDPRLQGVSLFMFPSPCDHPPHLASLQFYVFPSTPGQLTAGQTASAPFGLCFPLTSTRTQQAQPIVQSSGHQHLPYWAPYQDFIYYL